MENPIQMDDLGVPIYVSTSCIHPFDMIVINEVYIYVISLHQHSFQIYDHSALHTLTRYV